MPDQIVFCNQCGSQNTAGTTFCSKCGGSLGGVAQPLAATSAHPLAVPVRYGGFWIRVVAAIIDGILVQVVVVSVCALFGGGVCGAGVAARMPGGGTRLVGFIVGGALGV